MRFTFDPAKRTLNLKKHGFDLADAKPVIERGGTVTFEDLVVLTMEKSAS